VGNNDEVDDGEVFDMAWRLCITFWAHEGERTAAVFEDGVEENAEAGGELGVVAGVAEPCCSYGLRAGPRGEESRFDDRYGWRGGVGEFEASCQSTPV
jgi:hypothetical protein